MHSFECNKFILALFSLLSDLRKPIPKRFLQQSSVNQTVVPYMIFQSEAASVQAEKILDVANTSVTLNTNSKDSQDLLLFQPNLLLSSNELNASVGNLSASCRNLSPFCIHLFSEHNRSQTLA